MNKLLNIAAFILGLLVLVVFVLYGRVPKDGGVGEGATGIVRVADLAQASKALSELVDFSKVKPYNIQSRNLENGSVQEVLSFDTAHLEKNYEIIKQNMVEENKFSPKTDTVGSEGFTLSFERGGDRFEAVGVPKIPASLRENSTIIISFYHRP